MKRKLILKSIALMLICIFCVQSTVLANSADYTSTPVHGKVIELEGLRTADSKTYQLSDGSFKYVGYAEDVHYEDSNGKFYEIDNSIPNAIRVPWVFERLPGASALLPTRGIRPVLPLAGALLLSPGNSLKNLRPHMRRIFSPARRGSEGILAVLQAATTQQEEQSAHVRPMVS